MDRSRLPFPSVLAYIQQGDVSTFNWCMRRKRRQGFTSAGRLVSKTADGPWYGLLPLALWWIYLFLADSYGKVDLGAVIFHLQAGIADNGSGGRIFVGMVYTLTGLIMLGIFTWLVRL